MNSVIGLNEQLSDFYSLESTFNLLIDINEYAFEADVQKEGFVKKAVNMVRKILGFIRDKIVEFGKWIASLFSAIKNKFSGSDNGKKSCNSKVLSKLLGVINKINFFGKKDTKATDSFDYSLFLSDVDIALEGNNTRNNKKAEKQNNSTNLATRKQINKLEKELKKLNTIKNGNYSTPGRNLTQEEKTRYNEIRNEIKKLGGVVSDNEKKIEKIKEEGLNPSNTTPNYLKIADQQQKTGEKIETIAKKYDNDQNLKPLAAAFRSVKTHVKSKDMSTASAMKVIVANIKKDEAKVKSEASKVQNEIKVNEKKIIQSAKSNGSAAKSSKPSYAGIDSPYADNEYTNFAQSNTEPLNISKNKSIAPLGPRLHGSLPGEMVKDTVNKQNKFMSFLKGIMFKIRALLDAFRVACM